MRAVLSAVRLPAKVSFTLSMTVPQQVLASPQPPEIRSARIFSGQAARGASMTLVRPLTPCGVWECRSRLRRSLAPATM